MNGHMVGRSITTVAAIEYADPGFIQTVSIP
jgi:hypothetical protein